MAVKLILALATIAIMVQLAVSETPSVSAQSNVTTTTTGSMWLNMAENLLGGPRQFFGKDSVFWGHFTGVLLSDKMIHRLATMVYHVNRTLGPVLGAVICLLPILLPVIVTSLIDFLINAAMGLYFVFRNGYISYLQ